MERARLVEATMNTASFNGLFRKDRPSNLHGASTGRCVLDGNLMPALEDELALVAPIVPHLRRGWDTSSRRISQHCRYQLRIHVLCNLFELAVMQANHKTIGVVIWLARLRGIVAARFHYNVVAFSNKPMANGFDPAINPRPQLSKQSVKDLLFAFISSRPSIAAGYGPAEIVCHALHQET